MIKDLVDALPPECELLMDKDESEGKDRQNMIPIHLV